MKRATEVHLSRRRWTTLSGLALLLWLAWRVLSLGAADHLAIASPRDALLWRGDHDHALLEAALASAPDAPASAADFARRALRANPLQGIAYRVLAMQSGSEAAAARLYGIAAQRAPRDVPSLAWLADRALARGEHAKALALMDQILRVEPAALAFVQRALEFAAGEPKAQAALAALIALRPPWRTSALVTLARKAPDLESLAGLFDRLRRDDVALSRSEIDAWIDRLIDEREWVPAYLTWASQLPPAQRESIGNVYNGGFEWEPTNIGFDWRFHRLNGAHVARSTIDGATGHAALRIGFDRQRVPLRHVEQLLALPPGHYELAGRARLDSLQASRGIAWSLACAEGGPPFAQTTPFVGSHGWKPFSLEFEVPAPDCGAQWLRLRNLGRTSAEQSIGGSAWFDDLKIHKLSTGDKAGG